MAINVGVNGFGRIGRLVFRAGVKNPNINFVAVNDLTDAKTLAHLFKYDSTFGIYPGKVEVAGTDLKIDGKLVKVLAEKDPAKLPWKDLKVDYVIESTGKFTEAEKARAHMAGGAKKVIITAPAKGEDITICMGINDDLYDPAKHHVVSNASCTTNGLAPVAKTIDEAFGIRAGIMTTIHAYTNDQPVLDFPHKDLRRARAAALSMIPTKTGAAQAIGLVCPKLKGKFTGCAIRVPTPDVSLVDLSLVVEKATTKEEVNAALKKASESPRLKGILEFCETPLVSIDFKGNPASSIVDAAMTDVMGGNLVKVFAWYDNEWGYSRRVKDLILFLVKKVL